jgi:hypothetical protein
MTRPLMKVKRSKVRYQSYRRRFKKPHVSRLNENSRVRAVSYSQQGTTGTGTGSGSGTSTSGKGSSGHGGGK